jgi:hypothetical protein
MLTGQIIVGKDTLWASQMLTSSSSHNLICSFQTLMAFNRPEHSSLSVDPRGVGVRPRTPTFFFPFPLSFSFPLFRFSGILLLPLLCKLKCQHLITCNIVNCARTPTMDSLNTDPASRYGGQQSRAAELLRPDSVQPLNVAKAPSSSNRQRPRVTRACDRCKLYIFLFLSLI